jgi:hypothetical protein
MRSLGTKALTLGSCVALLTGCATHGPMLTPQQEEAGMVVVGRVTGFGERDLYAIWGGGVDVAIAMGRSVILEPIDKPGEKVEFAGELPCPGDTVGDQLYLVYLGWAAFPITDGWLMLACTPIDPATSVGIITKLSSHEPISR